VAAGNPLVTLRVLALALLLLPGIAGCGSRGREAPPSGQHAAAVRAQALIDAGNQAFKTQDYALAAKRYAAAAVSSPDDPAAYFGLGMALAKLGRDEEARVAYARARELARQAAQP